MSKTTRRGFLEMLGIGAGAAATAKVAAQVPEVVAKPKKPPGLVSGVALQGRRDGMTHANLQNAQAYELALRDAQRKVDLSVFGEPSGRDFDGLSAILPREYPGVWSDDDG